jgi:hypothetical protein
VEGDPPPAHRAAVDPLTRRLAAPVDGHDHGSISLTGRSRSRFCEIGRIVAHAQGSTGSSGPRVPRRYTRRRPWTGDPAGHRRRRVSRTNVHRYRVPSPRPRRRPRTPSAVSPRVLSAAPLDFGPAMLKDMRRI